ncbi:glycosyltransferase [Anabaena sphaerica FACHB-251]|uniref:Glycosyltransferase n=1 Tax=Anabaena sphaerica FACHB-251 TaxID=2692883 RepID=A0A927A148_9NOST|nr:glycosyltransferase [Anabaena sphaerica]MBD2293060.1 glycosyltransferase [Anabaena sphaerica FACHB-251]
MKIAFFVGEFPLLSESFILNQLTGLIDRGHEVFIYSLYGKPSNLSKLHPNVEKYQLIERTYYCPKIPKNYLLRLLKGIGLVLANFPKSPLMLLQLINIFKYGKQAASLNLLYQAIPLIGQAASYDIIHCQFGTYGLSGRVFRQLGLIQGKIVTTFRGKDISRDIKKYGDNLYEQLFQEGEYFFTNCEFFRQRVLKLGCDENKIVVHGSGIDCNKFSFTPRNLAAGEHIKIATIGRLTEKKGIKYCIEAIAQVVKDYPHLEYNIIGDGNLKEDLEQLIENLNLQSVVKLLGSKQQKEIIDILNQSHLFIATSITAKDGDQDAPVNTLKEAMAMGLPVISTWHGGIPELVEDGVSGFLVGEGDSEAIAQSLLYLIEHPENWTQMGHAGRTRVEKKYNMQHLNDELVKIYQHLL